MNLSELSLALSSPEPRARLRALKAGMDLGSPDFLDVVIPRLGHETTKKVRIAMIHVIGRLGSHEHCQPLVTLLTDPEPDIRMKVVSALKDIADPASYPAVVRVLVSDPDAGVRGFAARALVEIGRGPLLDLFSRMLRSEDHENREAVILALGLFDSPMMVPILKLAYLQERGALRALALSGLDKLAGAGNDMARDAYEEFTGRSVPGREDAAGGAPGEEEARMRARIQADLKELESDGHTLDGLADTYTGALHSGLRFNPFETGGDAAPPPLATAKGTAEAPSLPTAGPPAPGGGGGASEGLPDRAAHPPDATPGRPADSGSSSGSCLPASGSGLVARPAGLAADDEEPTHRERTVPARRAPAGPAGGPTCPGCHQPVSRAALLCPDCGTDLATGPAPALPAADAPRPAAVILIAALDFMAAFLFLTMGLGDTGRTLARSLTPAFLVPAGLWSGTNGILLFMGFTAGWWSQLMYSFLIPVAAGSPLEWLTNGIILILLSTRATREHAQR